MANNLLQQVVKAFEKLPPESQNAIASRWLVELKDEQIWADKFAATTDAQWDQLVKHVRQDIAGGHTETLETFLDKSADL
ncbi:MAG: hypothetical protein AAF708_16605 [Deinococcota bacterium]